MGLLHIAVWLISHSLTNFHLPSRLPPGRPGPGQLFFKEDEPAQGLHIIASGMAKMTKWATWPDWGSGAPCRVPGVQPAYTSRKSATFQVLPRQNLREVRRRHRCRRGGGRGRVGGRLLGAGVGVTVGPGIGGGSPMARLTH